MLFGSVVFAAVIVVDCIVSRFCVVGDDQWDVDQRRKIMKKKSFSMDENIDFKCVLICMHLWKYNMVRG